MRVVTSVSGWVFSFVLVLIGSIAAEDFLYVSSNTKLHWVPAHSPQSARVLVDSLQGEPVLSRHRDELWVWNRELSKTDLTGQQFQKVPNPQSLIGSPIARQGSHLYAMGFGRVNGIDLWDINLTTGEERLLMTGDLYSAAGLVIHEDRLYFGSSVGIESVRIDGVGRRMELANAPYPRGLTLHEGTLLWTPTIGNEIYQVNLRTFSDFKVLHGLSDRSHDVAVTNEAIYWISLNTVWRRCHNSSQDEVLYQIGDRFQVGDEFLTSIAAVSATRHPATIMDVNNISVFGQPGEHFQLLYSDNLRTWSPDYLERGGLLPEDGVSTNWLAPKSVIDQSPVVWTPQSISSHGYFAAWRYDFEAPFDSDQDQLPDYWERRHFGDLSPTPSADSDGDGITHLEEARLLMGPLIDDADGDGLTDDVEVAFEPPLNPSNPDSDDDGLSDGDEVNLHGSNPHEVDSDGDGFEDAFEVASGSDPADPGQTPDSNRILEEFAEDLAVHYHFDTVQDGLIANAGFVGGNARLIGEHAVVIPADETATGSPAIEFALDPNDPKQFSYIETDLTLEDIGIAGESSFTIAFWLRTSKLHNGAVLNTGGDWYDMRLQFDTRADKTVYDIQPYVTFASLDLGGPPIVPGSWTHVVWTYKGDPGEVPEWQIYIDGKLECDSGGFETNIWLSGGKLLRIGARSAHLPTFPFQGALDDMRIYRGILPLDAITVLAQ